MLLYIIFYKKAMRLFSFDIVPGEVHVLIGENGAGKSTLMKILSGVYQPTSGKIICNGREYSRLSTADSYNEGIAIVYQKLSVINELSIMENLFVGKLPTKKVDPISVVDYKLMQEKASSSIKVRFWALPVWWEPDVPKLWRRFSVPFPRARARSISTERS